MKILIIGGYGMLGSAFPENIERLPRKNRDWYDINTLILWRNPDVVINCAGVTGFYRCENEPHRTFLANTALPIEIAYACREVGARMIHFSTFYVGDGAYFDSKNCAETALSKFDNTSIIYLPTLFDVDNLPMAYDESFHVAYTNDVADWTMNNLDMIGEEVFLCNEGYPTRKEFLEYAWNKSGMLDDVVTVKRMNNAKEAYGDLILMRPWKEAVDECFS